MKKVLKKLNLLFSAVAVIMLIGVTTVNAAEERNITFKKFSAGNNRYVWLSPKAGDLEHFYGAEDNGSGGFDYYLIDWNSNVSKTTDTVTPKVPEVGPVYTIVANDVTSEIEIKNTDGSVTLDSITYASLTTFGFASPKDATVVVLGSKDNMLYYAVKDTVKNEYIIINEDEVLISSQPIPGDMAVVGYSYANYGIIKASNLSTVMIINFEGDIVIPSGTYTKAAVNPFGLISLERKTGSEAKDVKTTLVDYQGNTLVAEMDGKMMDYVTSNVARSNDSSDYLKNGKHLFTINDPVSDTICHYILELGGNSPIIPVDPEIPNEDIENPKTSTGNVGLTVMLGATALGIILIATKKLKTDF